jgi:hypothetical protein
MIGISPQIEGTTFVLDTIVRADRKATHTFGLIVIHVHVGERDQPCIRVKGILARRLGCGISARQKKVEVFELVKGSTWEMRWEFLRHDGGKRERGERGKEKIEIEKKKSRNHSDRGGPSSV